MIWTFYQVCLPPTQSMSPDNSGEHIKTHTDLYKSELLGFFGLTCIDRIKNYAVCSLLKIETWLSVNM